MSSIKRKKDSFNSQERDTCLKRNKGVIEADVPEYNRRS